MLEVVLKSWRTKHATFLWIIWILEVSFFIMECQTVLVYSRRGLTSALCASSLVLMELIFKFWWGRAMVLLAFGSQRGSLRYGDRITLWSSSFHSFIVLKEGWTGSYGWFKICLDKKWLTEKLSGRRISSELYDLCCVLHTHIWWPSFLVLVTSTNF